MKADLYQNVTDQIIHALEQGIRPWHQPWSAAHLDGRVVLPLRHQGVPYRGVNIITLWMATLAKGYRSPFWMTFKQAIDLGACVRKGEKASPVVYADSITRTETDVSTGEQSAERISFLKSYSVFNAEQIEGLPPHFYAVPPQRSEPLPRNLRAEAFFSAVRADIRTGGDRAYYAAGSDYIQMPPFEILRRGKLLRDDGP